MRYTLSSILPVLCVLGASVPAHAQVDPEWVNRLSVGSSLYSGIAAMAVDDAGVTYVTGISGMSLDIDIVTAAYAPDGEILWSHMYDGPAGGGDQARGIAFGPGGVLYVTGNTPGPNDFANVLLLKYDTATGTLLNAVQYSSGPGTSEHGASVATDAQGGVYVGGGTVGDGADAMVLKFNAAGQFQWKRTWDGPALAPYSQDQVQELLVDANGDVVVMIHGVMGSLHPDYVILKYSPGNGATIWQAVWGVNGGDFPRDMEIDAAGDIYVTGTGINFNDRFSTIKLRGTNGQLLWQAYDSAGAHDSAAALSLDGQGGVYVTGSSDPDGDESNFNDNFYTVKRDAETGDLQWTHSYGLNCVGCYDVPADVVVDTAGHAFVVGRTSSAPYSGDMILFVLDAGTGVEIDRGALSGAAEEFAGPSMMRLDASQNVFIGGEFYNFNTGFVDISLVKYASMAGVPGDLDGDGTVGVADLLMLLSAWGPCPACPADCDADGTVGVLDLLIVLANWG